MIFLKVLSPFIPLINLSKFWFFEFQKFFNKFNYNLFECIYRISCQL